MSSHTFLTMFTSAFLLSCLACTSHGRRVHSLPYRSHEVHQSALQEEHRELPYPGRPGAAEPAEALARFLSGFIPAVGWHTGAEGRSWAMAIPLHAHRVARAPRLQGTELTEGTDLAASPSGEAPVAEEPLVRVLPEGCESCYDDFMARTEDAEATELERRQELRTSNISQLMDDVWENAMRMNETQRQILMLKTDQELRSYIENSSTRPSPLMEKVHNATMERVPYELAQYICGPDQGMLMRTLVGVSRPRRCLDVGSFTGFSSSSILEAMPDNATLTCLDVDPDFTDLAREQLADRKNVEFVVGSAIDSLRRFKQEGQLFDFICLDADKPMHGEYFNASLEVLRPGGIIIMFGMLLFPTPEDQEAMMELHTQLPNDTRITTAQLPLGCGIQLMVKNGESPELDSADMADLKRWQLESELAAIDRYVGTLGEVPDSTE